MKIKRNASFKLFNYGKNKDTLMNDLDLVPLV